MLKKWFPILRITLTLLGALIIIDCLALMAVGKINFGTVVPFMIGAVFIAHALLWSRIRQFIMHKRWLKRLWQALWGGFALWLVSFGLFVSLLQQQIKLSAQPISQVAAIIILGSGTEDGQPTPTLAARLDRAVPIINGQPQAIVITTGGIGFGREQSEAEIMANYLHKVHGIARTRILLESESTSTEENLIYSKPILQAQKIAIAEPIAIVTSDFHTIRASAIARHQGYA